jgi:branched-chain amino acid transport system permease protein
MCFALFASAFNLLIGYAGLLSFGHAMFLGMAGYAAAHTAKVGLVEGMTKVFYPQGSSVAIFIVMVAVLLFKPAGLFGKGPR